MAQVINQGKLGTLCKASLERKMATSIKGLYRGEVEGDSVLPGNCQLELRDFMGSTGQRRWEEVSLRLRWGFLPLYALIKYSLSFTGHGHMLNGIPGTSQGCTHSCLPV